MAKGSDLRDLLGKLGLNTRQKNAILDKLKGGGRFNDVKGLLREYGVKNVSNYRDAINDYIKSITTSPTPTPPPTPAPTPTPTPTPVVGPTPPTPTPPPTPTVFPTPTPTPPPTPTVFPTPTPTPTEELKPGEILRGLLDDFDLNTGQKRKVLDILKQGGRFGDIKDILKGFGVQNVGSLKDAVKSYVDYLGIDTPYVPPVQPPLLPGETESDSFDDDVNPYDGFGVEPFPPSPTPPPDDLTELFPSTGDYEETEVVGPVQPTPTPTPTPTTPSTPDWLQEFMDSFTFPEYPDFEGLMGEQAAMYEQMLADAQAERERLAAEAELRRRTEMSNMAQGSRVADFRAGITDRGRGGTSEFKRRGAPSSMLSINPMVNRSLSLGAGIMGRPRRTYR